MKRILVLGVLVVAVCSCYLGSLSLADEKSAAKWESVTIKLESGLTERVQVLRIWDSPARDAKWPQLALLRLSPRAYKELRKNFKALKSFIDGDKTEKQVFDAPVTITEGCKLPEPEDDSADDTSWLVIVSHRTSRCSCTALLEHAIAH